MPFDMMQNNGGGGGNDIVGKALAILVSSMFSSGARPQDFGGGFAETLNVDIRITVSPDNGQFRIDGARLNRWEQIEVDPDSDSEDLIG